MPMLQVAGRNRAPGIIERNAAHCDGMGDQIVNYGISQEMLRVHYVPSTASILSCPVRNCSIHRCTSSRMNCKRCLG